jgi:hypothetical protein
MLVVSITFPIGVIVGFIHAPIMENISLEHWHEEEHNCFSLFLKNLKTLKTWLHGF